MSKSCLREVQLNFCRAMRNPNQALSEDAMADQRLSIYQQLIFHGIGSAISPCFPVIKSVLSEQEWNDLVRGFIRKHACRTPLFHQIAGEFVEYLLHERSVDAARPYLAELAHYEWAELAIDCRDAEIEPHRIVAASQDVMRLSLTLSPLAMLAHYSYPVDAIGPEFLPSEDDRIDTWIMIYRDLNNDVCFMKMNQTTVLFIDRIVQGFQANEALASLSLANSLEEQAAMEHCSEALIRELCEKTLLIIA